MRLRYLNANTPQVPAILTATNKQTNMWILYSLLIAALVIVPISNAIKQRKKETAEALYFNRQAMPVLLLPDHPFDDNFMQRVDQYRKSLEECQNQWRPKIIATPYFAPIADAQTVNKNFHQYILLQIEEWQAECERWAEEKYRNSPEYAHRKIAGV